MVRLCASPEHRILGVLFANVVTEEVPCRQPNEATVPRSGHCSIFDMFTRCFRKCVRDNCRSGLTNMEMNAALEREGFIRVRFRKSAGKRFFRNEDGPSSFFRFGARRFRDPENQDDLEFLQRVWPQVLKTSPVACALPVVLQCLREARDLECDRGRRPTALTVECKPPTSSCSSPMRHMELMRTESNASVATTVPSSPHSTAGLSMTQFRDEGSDHACAPTSATGSPDPRAFSAITHHSLQIHPVAPSRHGVWEADFTYSQVRSHDVWEEVLWSEGLDKHELESFLECP